MPVGQFTGGRSAYIYENDAGTTYLLSLDTTNASLPGTGLVLATTATAATGSPKPARFTPRGVFWQATSAPIGARKFLTCGDVTSTLYASETSQALTVDGVAGVTTGRVGEKMSFLVIGPNDPAPG